jgi:hypothetical protein
MSRQKMTAEQRAAKKAERAAKMRAKMAGIEHRLFGGIVSAPVPGTVFDPLLYLTCPGRYRDVRAFFRTRAARAGVGAGLPRETRAAVLDDAVMHAMDFFIHRDYAKVGFDADAACAALLSAARWMDRARWRSIDETQAGNKPRKGTGDFLLYNRAQASRVANAAAEFWAAESMGMVWREVFPEIHEIPGEAVEIPGGPSGRGETDGKMVRDGGRVKWRMKRGRGRAAKLPACTVRDSVTIPAPRHIPTPTPTRGMPATPGTESGEGSGHYRQGERKAYVMSLSWFAAQCERHGID